MDAVEFLKETKRMCDSYDHCVVCPACKVNNKHDCKCSELLSGFGEDLVSIVENWSKEHPIITNAIKFKEVFGTEPNDNSDDKVCPPIGHRLCDDDTGFTDCSSCCKWWDKEYKAPDEKDN